MQKTNYNEQRYSAASTARKLILTVAIALSGTRAFSQTPPGSQGILQNQPIAADSFFSRTVQEGTHPTIGFAVGMDTSYSSGLSSKTLGTDSRLFTSLSPRLFAGLNKRTARGHISLFTNNDLRYERIRYDKVRYEMNSTHSLVFDSTWRLSPRTSLGLNDTMNSAVNDSGNLLLQSSVITFSNIPSSQTLDVARQRITQNSASMNIGHVITSRWQVRADLSHQWWHYHQNTEGNNQGIQLGVQSSYRMKKWLSLNNNYSTYLYQVKQGAGNAQIHRLEVGELNFESGRHLGLSFGGGVEASPQNNSLQPNGSFHVMLYKKSPRTAFSLRYFRGLSIASGTRTVFAGNNYETAFNHWMTRRVQLQVGSGYTTGKAADGSSLDYFAGASSVSIALSSHMLASAQYSYVSQRLSALDFGVPHVSRYTAAASLQFSLPSLLDRN